MARIDYARSLILHVINRQERNINFKAKRNSLRAVVIKTMSRYVPTMPIWRVDILLSYLDILQGFMVCRLRQVVMKSVCPIICGARPKPLCCRLYR
jgi:hypothetical protein